MIYIKVIYDLRYSVIWKYKEKNSLEFLWNSRVPSIYLNKDSRLLLHERVLVSGAIADKLLYVIVETVGDCSYSPTMSVSVHGIHGCIETFNIEIQRPESL